MQFPRVRSFLQINSQQDCNSVSIDNNNYSMHITDIHLCLEIFPCPLCKGKFRCDYSHLSSIIFTYNSSKCCITVACPPASSFILQPNSSSYTCFDIVIWILHETNRPRLCGTGLTNGGLSGPGAQKTWRVFWW